MVKLEYFENGKAKSMMVPTVLYEYLMCAMKGNPELSVDFIIKYGNMDAMLEDALKWKYGINLLGVYDDLKKVVGEEDAVWFLYHLDR
jgi:hypothetical protein